MWAGIDDFDYNLVTAYENMHAVKPSPDYYREILECLGRKPGEAIMVGDDWQRDIVPADKVGLLTYWIAPPKSPAPDSRIPLVGQGSMADLKSALLGD